MGWDALYERMAAHVLAPGDELFDKTDATYTVTEVNDDGSVTFEIDGGSPERFAVDHRSATWSEGEVVIALTEGLLETPDGSGAELVDA